MPRTRVKVCGVRDIDAALAAADAGADAVGLMFVEGSPRCISPEQGFEILANLPPLVTGVGVVQDLSVDDFSDLEQVCPAPVFQFHGSEPEKTVRACGPGVIKAFKFESETIAADLARWEAVDEVDLVLIDGSAGGEGKAFDWTALGEASQATSKLIMLAGGLTPDNVGDAIRAVRPFAVDVSSGVESAPGIKDQARIEAFCAAVRDADAG
ncbi:MAG: phosphoribosylanthranilate isomerase [Planctomycetota bacterium]